MDDDGLPLEDNSEHAGFTSVRSRTKQFEGDHEDYEEPSVDHVPYKYDDALKYRFPEQKNYVAAHNYIPAPGGMDKGQHKFADSIREKHFQRFNYAQPFFDRDETSRLTGLRNANWREATNKQSPYGVHTRAGTNVASSVHRISNGLSHTNAATQGVDMRDRARGHGAESSRSAFLRDGATGRGPGSTRSAFVPPVYTYDDEKMLLQALQDGTYGLTAVSDAATTASADAAKTGMFNMPEPNGTMYNYQRLHPLSTAPATGEKAYFNMSPRIYDYKDNTYHPITMDDQLAYVEKKRLFSMGLSPGEIA